MAPALKAGWEGAGEPEAEGTPVASAPEGTRGVEVTAGALGETTGVVGTATEEVLVYSLVIVVVDIDIRLSLPLVALGHGLGHEGTGDGEGTVGHGDVSGLEGVSCDHI